MRAAAVIIVLLCGCLKEEPPVNARRLFEGRDVDRPFFTNIEEELWVQLDVRTAPASGSRGATSDVWLVNWESGEKRMIGQNRSALLVIQARRVRESSRPG